MSSDFGGDVRAGASVGAADGAMDGLAEGTGTTMTDAGTGATQSSGCTTVFPVVASYEMIRTPDCAAHDASS